MHHRSCTLLLLSLVVLGAIVSTLCAAEPPVIVKMKTKQGDVLFHHQEHLAAVNECTDCHHMGLEAGGCRDCHGVDKNVPRVKHAFHRQCRNCHIKAGASKECTTCHKK